MNRTIITVIGKDRVGIIATVCTYLAEHKINILDIDQSIIQGYFHLMMIVDANGADKEFASMVKDLEKIGEDLGVQIKMQPDELLKLIHAETADLISEA